MIKERIFRGLILLEVLLLAGLSIVCVYRNREVHCLSSTVAEAGEQAGEFIKWGDLNSRVCLKIITVIFHTLGQLSYSLSLSQILRRLFQICVYLTFL